MVYDGAREVSQNDGVHVIVEGSKVKLRVTHFTQYSIVLAPLAKLIEWMYPVPELLLDIWAYMKMADTVLLRIYALKVNDNAGKQLVQMMEHEVEGSRCAIPTTFILNLSKKNLDVKVTDVYPIETWVPNEMVKSILFRYILVGGLGARCEMKFQLKEDVVEHPNRFEGAFHLEQEGNENNTEGIYFDNEMACRARARANHENQPAGVQQPEQNYQDGGPD